MAKNTFQILVTGEHADSENFYPSFDGMGQSLTWKEVPVLEQERLPVDPEFVKGLIENPVDWIIFTSPRAVHFWSEVILENGLDFPIETQVACIGEKTATVAGQDGFSTDFYPTEPGTEAFLEEFEALVTTNNKKPRVFIPAAEGGRPTIAQKLKELSCEVISIPLYRTKTRADIRASMEQAWIDSADLLVFTSPSSVDALTKNFQIPSSVKVATLGTFTADYLKGQGFSNVQVLPSGDFARVGEIL